VGSPYKQGILYDDVTFFPMSSTLMEERPIDGFTQQVYATIARNSGRIKSFDLDVIFGKPRQVRSAITQLTLRHKIKRIKGFGNSNGIEYFYKVL